MDKIINNKLESCPFCGNTEENDGIGYLKYQSRSVEEDGYDRWSVCVECLHCMAQGSHYEEDTAEEAAECATQSWNSAGRPSWWHKNVKRRYNQLVYDFFLYREYYTEIFSNWMKRK
jgi:hypothetical protein